MTYTTDLPRAFALKELMRRDAGASRNPETLKPLWLSSPVIMVPGGDGLGSWCDARLPFASVDYLVEAT